MKMDDNVEELEEFSLYSEFLEVVSELVEIDEFDISDVSNEEVEMLTDEAEEASDHETDNDILRCIMSLIELECVLHDDDPKTRRKGERRWGVHPLNQMRREQGHFHNLFEEMLLHDHDKFFNYTRMTPERFQHLFELIEPMITKNAPNAIPAKCRLLLTLRYFFNFLEVNLFDIHS